MIGAPRRALNIALWGLAGICLLSVALIIFLKSVGPQFLCERQEASAVISMDGVYFAKFYRTTCPPGAAESRGEVGLGNVAAP
jgi:hypothetical protein